MRILFIGGTGVISSACARKLVSDGHEVTLLNRGSRPVEFGARQWTADINDRGRVSELMEEQQFDSVVDWIAYQPVEIGRSFELVHGKTAQYIFISSASVYRKPMPLHFSEKHPVENPYWEYAHNKIRCEQALHELHVNKGFPVTIVRPSHTYNETKIPLHGGFTALHRILTGKTVIVHDEGKTKWTLTHSDDFAVAFAALAGNPAAVGQTYHITGDEALTWDEIARTLGRAVGKAVDIVHVPSAVIREYDTEWGDGLLGDKAWDMVPDNSKIRQLAPDFRSRIPFAQGAKQIVDWYRRHAEAQVVSEVKNKLMDHLAAQFG
jgi:nucleoside-diphosphate-sugar epimerase